MNNKQFVGREVGTVSVSMYEEDETGLPIFYIRSESKQLAFVSRAIENTLNNILDWVYT